MIPKHIAVIPDGNRRWAKSHILSGLEGHTKGYEIFKNIKDEAFNRGVEYFSFWAMSEDNIKKRDSAEVSYLFKLLSDGLDELVADKRIQAGEASFSCIGNFRALFPKELVEKIDNIEGKFRKPDARFHLQLMLAYNGGSEMREAVKAIAREGVEADSITDETIRSHLWSRELPPVDLVIRSGGEPHLSAGFMMWLTQNSQLYFTQTLWPDFSSEEFSKALAEYEARERRYGK